LRTEVVGMSSLASVLPVIVIARFEAIAIHRAALLKKSECKSACYPGHHERRSHEDHD